MSDSEFKKGDRVRVEYEGTVGDVGLKCLGIAGPDDYYYSAPKSGATLLERPVEPLAVGSVVRSANSGSLWRVQPDGVEYVGVFGVTPSVYNAKTLAKVARDYPNNYTLIYDGSKA